MQDSHSPVPTNDSNIDKSSQSPCRIQRCATIGCLIVIVGSAILLAVGYIYCARQRATAADLVEERLAALKADGIPTTPAELDAYYTHVPEEENAAPIFLSAFEKMVDLDGFEEIPVPKDMKVPEPDKDDDISDEGEWEYTPFFDEFVPILGVAELELGAEPEPLMQLATAIHIKRNAEALRLLHMAAKMERCRFPLPITTADPMYFMPMDHLSKLRASVQLLQLECLHHIWTNAPDKAIASLIAARRCARALDNEPTMISALVSIACDSITTNQLADLLSRTKLSVSQCDQLIRVWKQGRDTPRMARGFAGEIIFVDQTSTSDASNQGITNSDSEDVSTRIFMWAYRYTGLMDLDRAYMIDTLNDCIRTNQLTYTDRQQAIQKIEDSIEAEFSKPREALVMEGRFFAALVLPAVTRATIAGIKSAAQRRMAIAALRLEELHRQNGTYPDTLDEVSKAYPSDNLTDPFIGKPLRYKTTENGYLLYSVGEDNVDNGGDDSQQKGIKPDMVFRVIRKAE